MAALPKPVTGGILVPFGKYKGKPLELLAQDESYQRWMASNPQLMDWLKDRDPSFHSIVINNFSPVSDDTPEHNAIQAMFCSKQFCVAVAFTAHQVRAFSEYGEPMDQFAIARREFELGGFDVVYSVTTRHQFVKEPISFDTEDEAQRDAREIEEATGINSDVRSRYDYKLRREIYSIYCWSGSPGTERVAGDYGIEIKPALGDDFPSVLRQVKRAKPRGRDAFRIVLCGEYVGRGASLSDVREMFADSNIALLTFADLRASGLDL